MANPEHLEILKRGVKVWNKWRKQHPTVGPDLSGANLCGLNLTGADFNLAFHNEYVAIGATFAGEGVEEVVESNSASRADFRMADLTDANLTRAKLLGADLREAHLSGIDLWQAQLVEVLLNRAYLQKAKLYRADLEGAHLDEANLSDASLNNVNLDEAWLTGTNFTGAKLSRTTFYRAHLDKTNFTKAHLSGVDFNNSYLSEANFSESWIESNIFSFTSLSTVRGLETVKHGGPSSIGIETIYRSKGNIPEPFLRGCGLPDNFITYMHSLAEQPIQFYSCFISYSSKDQEFADRIYADLQARSVRCWFAPEDLEIGDRFRTRIDEVIRVHDKLLLVLSENSVSSTWVEKEVETAMEREQEQKRALLFPVRLDNAVMEIKTGWPADIRRTRHIGDFTGWKNHNAYQKAFERLLRGLKAEAHK